MDDLEERIAAVVRQAIESGEIIEVSHEAHRLAAAQGEDGGASVASERDIAEALADCAVAARVPLQIG